MSFASSRVWALQQVFRGIKNAKGVFFLALMLASLSLTIPVFVASVLYSLSEPIRAIPVAPEITVFTYQDLNKAQMDNLRERIGRHEHVMKITTIPKDEAFKSLNENLGIKQTSQDKAANPLPDLIIVTLDAQMPAADIERTAKNIEKLAKPYQRLKDIFRFTICRKYYQDTEETLQLFANDSHYAVEKKEIKDTFHGNQNVSSAYETKNYREKRVYLNIDGVKIEVQIKISKLYEGDIITHDIYAGEENEESRNDNILLISRQNTQNKGMRFWEENKGRYLTYGDKKIVQMKLLEKQMEAQKVNKQKIREANLQVLDKAFRLEDAKRANGKGFDAICINPISKKEQKVYKSVGKFIQDNFMYRPFKAFDMKQKFNVTDKELKSLGLVITSEQLNDLFTRYAAFILPKYNGRIDGNEAAYFSKAKNQEKISAIFAENASNEQALPPVEADADEQEMLQELEHKPLDAQKYNKILAKKQRYYHNKKQIKYKLDNLVAER